MTTDPPAAAVAADAPARPESRNQKMRRLRERFLHEQDHRCPYCGCEMVLEPNRWNSATLDHVVPRAHGGTNVPGNLVVACLHCNSSRNDRPADPVGRILALRAIAEDRARRRRAAGQDTPQPPSET